MSAASQDDVYQESLRVLANVPAALKAELGAAGRAQAEQTSAVDRDVAAELERLAKLRRTVEERYRQAAEELSSRGAALARQVRPSNGRAGDADALARALAAQAAAVDAAHRAARQAERDAAQEQARLEREENERRDRAARAAVALRQRQDRARREREEAHAAEAARMLVAGVRRRRIRIAVIATAAVLVVATGILIAIAALH